MEAYAYLVGLLHDLGKALPGFQRYLQAQEERIPSAKFPHSPWGAALGFQLISQLLGSEKGIGIILPVAGHHSGCLSQACSLRSYSYHSVSTRQT
jgi:CRISPR-associated endonuclease/helicase Cas3